LKSALSSKAAEGKIVIIEDTKAKSHKTKDMAKSFEKLGIASAVVIAGGEMDANFARATSNIPLIDVFSVEGANVYDIMRRDTLVMTKDAVDALTKKLKD
jgi:large subunit ribosomal protein L4